MSFHAPNKYRIRTGRHGTDDNHGNNGAFMFPGPHKNRTLFAIVSDGEGWDHVSIHVRKTNQAAPATPWWDEMEFTRKLFWGDDSTVMQLHVPAKDHINIHPNVLHLWRPQLTEIPAPPEWMV